jgi:hypothetical protein
MKLYGKKQVILGCDLVMEEMECQGHVDPRPWPSPGAYKGAIFVYNYPGPWFLIS